MNVFADKFPVVSFQGADRMNIDEFIEELGRKKFDFEYRAKELSKVPIESLEGQELQEFCVEFSKVSDGVNAKLALARRFSCKSLATWERCSAELDCILHRLLANPEYLECLSTGRLESLFDDILKANSS